MKRLWNRFYIFNIHVIQSTQLDEMSFGQSKISEKYSIERLPIHGHIQFHFGLLWKCCQLKHEIRIKDSQKQKINKNKININH